MKKTILSVLFGLLAGLLSYTSAHAVCADSERSAVGICPSYCPNADPATGNSWISHNCTCGSSDAAGDCKASGVCHEYIAGQATGVEKDCGCTRLLSPAKDREAADAVGVAH